MASLRSGPNEGAWQRTSLPWDELESELALWEEDGDCLVFLSENHAAQAPVFCVRSELLRYWRCGPLLADTIQTPYGLSLFLPAPAELDQEDADRFHVTTRNFIAWLLGKPILGATLAQALIDLYNRMPSYREHGIDNRRDILSYARTMGYTILVNSPQHALAMLQLADETQQPKLWSDAFAHAAAMFEDVRVDPTYKDTKEETAKLLQTTYGDAAEHVLLVSDAIFSFLEDDISHTCVSLERKTVIELESFKSFLCSFYIDKYGYWPPTAEDAFSNDIFKDMRTDFQCLHNLLVDVCSESSATGESDQDGGVCIAQTIKCFNSRHEFHGLPLCLPLMPSLKASKRPGYGQLLRKRSGLKKDAKNSIDQLKAATAAATNRNDSVLLTNPLVKEYLYFVDAQIGDAANVDSIGEARKMHWYLIYGMLQTLCYLLDGPDKAQDFQGCCYPLWLTQGVSAPWLAAPPLMKAPDLREHPALRNSTSPNAEDITTLKTGISSLEAVEEDDVFFQTFSGSSATSEGRAQDPRVLSRKAPDTLEIITEESSPTHDFPPLPTRHPRHIVPQWVSRHAPEQPIQPVLRARESREEVRLSQIEEEDYAELDMEVPSTEFFHSVFVDSVSPIHSHLSVSEPDSSPSPTFSLPSPGSKGSSASSMLDYSDPWDGRGLNVTLSLNNKEGHRLTPIKYDESKLAVIPSELQIEVTQPSHEEFIESEKQVSAIYVSMSDMDLSSSSIRTHETSYENSVSSYPDHEQDASPQRTSENITQHSYGAIEFSTPYENIEESTPNMTVTKRGRGGRFSILGAFSKR